jgi:hypothetical protein
MKRNISQNLCTLGCGLATLTLMLPSRAAVLTSVPMQGGMVMPMLSYSATAGALLVNVDPAIPALTPLLASNPGDRFDPGDPWYDSLDPSRQGLAFSRRYGFVMNTGTDPLPGGTAIWIRKLSGSPELGAYRYRSTAPKAWEPIFGTAGSTNALLWDGMMFHPEITAPPGTNSYSATFEAFLADTSTGSEVPGSSTGPFTLNWKSTPDGRPALSLAQKIVIAWPASTSNWVLEAADTLPSANWTTLTNAPVMLDGQPAVVLDASGAGKFFRLRLAP